VFTAARRYIPADLKPQFLTIKTKTMFVARQSDHIQEDIKRNWSSWNFGLGGFEGTKEQFEEYLASATDSKPCHVSGFDIYKDDLKNFEFGELYENYHVAIDCVSGGRKGLSCVYLKAETLDEAIKEAETRTDYWGEGKKFDASVSKLVYTNGFIHVFEVNN
jgi:hypothetical protein